MPCIIKKVIAYEVLDSRGFPTIEVRAFSQGSLDAAAIVPSGASTGKYEALELRDSNFNLYHGKGILKAAENVNTIINCALTGANALDQQKIDRILISLDGTNNKSKLGANAVLGVSLAIAKLASKFLNIPLYRYISDIMNVNDIMNVKCEIQLPIPMINLINGGLHSNNKLSIQEFMIVPIGYNTFREAIENSAEAMYKLKELLCSKNLSIAVGDEGGFAPITFQNTKDALNPLMEIISTNNNLKIALDAAASTFYDRSELKYSIDGLKLDYKELTDYYCKLIDEYPIISIEDPMAEEDYEAWKYLTTKIGNKAQIVGDDIFVTQIQRFKKYALKENIANAILIKPNQVGTLTETLETIACAKENNYTTIISHRSGETEDTTISHLAVATASKFVKFGSLARSERVAKYNELLRIEDSLFAC